MGGGGARGCAHIGVIKALEEANISIHCIAGTSMGALVGGIYAAGHLQDLENLLSEVKWSDVLRQFDPAVMKNGMFKGKKVHRLINRLIQDKKFKDCQIPCMAIATDLNSGEEVRLDKGNIADAIRASISLPGIFMPIKHKKHHLVDGGILNPLPISAVRKMGADIVIAVDLSQEYIKEKQVKRSRHTPEKKWRLGQWLRPEYPNMIDVIEGAVFLMQKTVTEKNLMTDPADLLLSLNLSSASLFDFHKAKKLIEEGYKAGKKIMPQLKAMMQ